MADKATAPKKAVSQKAELNPEEQLVAKRHDLLEARKSLAAGELINPRVITATRKDIARLLTTINAQKETK